MQINPQTPPKPALLAHYRFVVVGAGPVGLLCANLLGQAGQSCLLVDKLPHALDWSRAIGISPPSLDILDSLGLASACVQSGHPIRQVWVHGDKKRRSSLGGVDFSKLLSDFPFMLALPQQKTEQILRQRLSDWPSVTFRPGAELFAISQSDAGVAISLRQADGGQALSAEPIRTDFALACDGLHSTVRELLGIDWHNRRYKDSFVMGDFPQSPEISKLCGKDAHLFFTADGAVESFPLPDNRRRWIVQTASFQENPAPDLISTTVYLRTGLNIGQAEPDWQSPFGVRRDIAETFMRNRVFLLGDAAHIMSPIGGQGMNTGFADAADLLPLLVAPEISSKRLKAWEKHRRRAFRIAAGRAERSMALGTVRGRIGSGLRNLLLWAMLNGPWLSKLRSDYAMLSVPRLSR